MRKNPPSVPHETLHILHQNSAQRLSGYQEENLKFIEAAFSVHVTLRGEELIFRGERAAEARAFVEGLKNIWEKDYPLSPREMEEALELFKKGKNPTQFLHRTILYTVSGHAIRAKTQKQLNYIQAIEENDLTLGIGPAGTGKTFLAVAMAVNALKAKSIQRIILTRPVVEAGERLGFLPGDIQQKVDPYFRPLYDALFEMMETDKFQKLLERNIVEIAPLAYMRGRTLNDAFIILDEAQNATYEQLKMFLTRMGFGSKMVITGDPTQTDLPQKQLSGLERVLEILQPLHGVKVIRFSSKEVIRHPLVQRMVEAFEGRTR